MTTLLKLGRKFIVTTGAIVLLFILAILAMLLASIVPVAASFYVEVLKAFAAAAGVLVPAFCATNAALGWKRAGVADPTKETTTP